LQKEPIRLEPKEEIDAEDDGKGAEADPVCIPARPAKQHVERVGEEQLSKEEVTKLVNGRPVPSPIQEDQPLSAGLNIMLLPRNDLELDIPTGQGESQKYVPSKQHGRDPKKRPKHPGILPDGPCRRESGETQSEYKRENKNLFAVHRIPVACTKAPALLQMAFLFP